MLDMQLALDHVVCFLHATELATCSTCAGTTNITTLPFAAVHHENTPGRLVEFAMVVEHRKRVASHKQHCIDSNEDDMS